MIFPKYRGDLVACATAARRMHEGLVEATRYPRNPLDVLAQQIVATVAMDRLEEDTFDLVRGAAPFADLDRGVFEGVLDMLAAAIRRTSSPSSGRASRGTVSGTPTAREGAKRVAIANGGTIPDRGLYGVFLVGAPAPPRASASWTRRWCSRAASARRSCSAPPRGGSRTSLTTASSSRRRRASRQDAVLEGRERVAWLVSEGVAPERIMLLTFTRRAAREMLQRTRALVPDARGFRRRARRDVPLGGAPLPARCTPRHSTWRPASACSTRATRPI